MDKNNKKGIIIGVLITVVIIGAIYLILSLTNDSVITKDMLYGTYKWSKEYTNEYGSNLKLNVTLVLNEDGTATYNAGDGYSAEATKGTYKFENNKIVYTREYYNYPNQENSKFDDDNNKTEFFKVIDKNTLQNTFNDQLTELKKQGNVTSNNNSISKFVGTYKYTYSFTQNDVPEDSGCKTINLNATLELKADGTFTYGRGANCSGGESANGTYSINDNKIYLYNQECVEDGNCRQKIELQISESNGVVTIKDNESTSGWKANSMWGSTKLPETILQKVN